VWGLLCHHLDGGRLLNAEGQTQTTNTCSSTTGLFLEGEKMSHVETIWWSGVPLSTWSAARNGVLLVVVPCTAQKSLEPRLLQSELPTTT
jgi:hypothetical protein